MYRWFEKRINPYPNNDPQPVAKNLLSFLWQMTKGIRFYILLLIFFSAFVSAFETFLFAVVGKVIDKLSIVTPIELWQKEGYTLCVYVGIYIG